MLLDLADAFGQGTDWDSRALSVRRRLLSRLATQPAEARLVFIEAMRDHALRERRALNRRWIIEYLSRKHGGGDGDRLALQFEMMIGAGFQMIAGAVAGGEDVDVGPP